jgi:hypothetical protein
MDYWVKGFLWELGIADLMLRSRETSQSWISSFTLLDVLIFFCFKVNKSFLVPQN